MSLQNLNYSEMAKALRLLSIESITNCGSGHPGMPMGMADVMTYLFANYLKISPLNPNWEERDRFVLSAGHGAASLYSALHLMHYPDFSIKQLQSLRSIGSITSGHPEMHQSAGIELTTGMLGHGLASAVGMSIAAAKGHRDYNVYTVVGDGCLMEGISQEAISLAGHLSLRNLTVIWDNNNITIDGSVDISDSTNQVERFKASNWDVIEIDGHNFDEIKNALNFAVSSIKPTLISCKTIIGLGSSVAGTSKVHGSPLSKEEVQGIRESYGWGNLNSFEIPSDVLDMWNAVVDHKNHEYNRVNNKTALPANLIESSLNLENTYKISQDNKEKDLAGREAFGLCLNGLYKDFPNIIGGSADLSSSVKTFTDSSVVFDQNNYNGNYINYGIREHAMAAIMNGIAASREYLVYGGTFMVFSDFMRPAIRMAAIMELPVWYVLTHDSIYVGGDGPTHQPIEHIPSLSLIPNLMVYRPCNIRECAECMDLSINVYNKSPGVFALSRQSLPSLQGLNVDSSINQSSKGAYIISDKKDASVNLVASGSEVSLAIKVSEGLEALGIKARVVSMPSYNVFIKQSKDYIESIIPTNTTNVLIQASDLTIYKHLFNKTDIFVGLNDFGLSAEGSDIAKHFGICEENIIKLITDKLNND